MNSERRQRPTSAQPFAARGVAVAVLCLTIPALVEAQPQALFKGGVEMVPLTVTVTDGRGQPVAGLTRDDFQVLEDGVTQPVTFFSTGELPLDLALVLDISGSMTGRMTLVREAASGLIHTMRPDDRGAVFTVSTSVSVPQDFTHDQHAVSAAIDAVPPGGSSAVFDGVYVALNALARQHHGTADVRRQVLVVLSDGQDNASHVSADDVAMTAARLGAQVYVIAITSAHDTRGWEAGAEVSQAVFDLKALAHNSGARTFQPPNLEALPGIYEAIAHELANQYDLGYVPVNEHGGTVFRHIAVKVCPPASGDARTRSGYYPDGLRSDHAAQK